MSYASQVIKQSIQDLRLDRSKKRRRYVEKLIVQIDKQTTYIDSVYVDVDEGGNMKLNNIGQNVGYRPNKIYFNISDGSFYKLGADGLTFTVVDVADFQD